MRGRDAVVLAALVVAVAAAPASPASASGTGAGDAASAPPAAPVERTVRFNRTPARPGSVRVTVTLRIGDGVRRLGQSYPENATVIRSRGFGRENGSLRWDRRTRTPSVTLRLDNRSTGIWDTDVPAWVDAGEWAFLYHLRFATGYLPDGSAEWVATTDRPGAFETRRVVEGEGIATDDFVYLGPHETHTRRVAGERLRLVVPAAAAANSTPAEILDAVGTAARHLGVGGRSGTVYLVVAPTGPFAVEGGPDGLTFSGDSAWVRDTSEDPGAYVHEYVHTRQNFTTTDRTRWLVEATANYYTHLELVRQGYVDYGERGWEPSAADRTNASTILSRPSQWASFAVPYRFGPPVLAALDARIRNATGGNRTFQAVFRRLNRHEGTVTHADLVRIAGRVAGADQGGWLREHVRRAALPDPPDDPFFYTVPGSQDTDGDGLSASRERALGTNPLVADTDGDGVPDDSDPTPAGDGDGNGADGAGAVDLSDGVSASEAGTIAGAVLLLVGFWGGIVAAVLAGVVAVAGLVDRAVSLPAVVADRSARRLFGLALALGAVAAAGGGLVFVLA